MGDIQHSTLIRHSTFNFQRSMFNVQYSPKVHRTPLSVRTPLEESPLSNIEYSMFNAPYSMLHPQRLIFKS